MADETDTQKRPPRKAKSLVRKLTEIMGVVDQVEKKGWNDFHKYAYLREAELYEAVRGAMAERHVLLVPSITSVERHEGGLSTLSLLYRLMDGDSGEVIEIPWRAEGQDLGDKGLAKALTNAKYLISKLFLIPSIDADGEPTDAENPRTEVQPAKAVVRPQSTPESSPQSTPTNGERRISEPQSRRLFAICMAKKQEPKAVLGYLTETYGTTSLGRCLFEDVKRSDYDQIVMLVESGQNFTSDDDPPPPTDEDL